MKKFLLLIVCFSLWCGAQEIRRPTVEADDQTASICSGNTDASTAMPNFYDVGGLSTSSTLTETTDSNGLRQQRVFYTWATPSGTYSSLSLKINSSCTVVDNFWSVECAAQYSTNGGSTWTTIFHTYTSMAQSTSTVALPAGQDLSRLRVRVCVAASGMNDGNNSQMTLTGFDIWTEGTLPTTSKVKHSSQVY